MSRAFVTGATGFLGRRLVHALRSGGHAVTAFVRDENRARALLGPEVALCLGDLELAGPKEADLAGHDVLFHLAAWYSLGEVDEVRMRRLNDEAVGDVLEAAARAGVPRVVHCSSVGVYGNTRGAVATEGHYDQESVSALTYTRTKRGGHLRALDAATQGQDVVIAVPASIFGAEDPSIIGRLLDFVRRGFMPIAFYRTTRMAFVHVDDVASGLILAWLHGTAGREYVLTERTMSLEDVFSAAARAAGRTPPLLWLPDFAIRFARPLSPLFAPIFGQGPRVLDDAVNMMEGATLDFDGTRARTELGWTPLPFAERLAQTLDAPG